MYPNNLIIVIFIFNNILLVKSNVRVRQTHIYLVMSKYLFVVKAIFDSNTVWKY